MTRLTIGLSGTACRGARHSQGNGSLVPLLLLAVMGGLLPARPAAAQCQREVVVEYDDPLSLSIGTDDVFGSAVAMHFETAVVSSPGDDVGPGDSVDAGGSLRAFVRSPTTWTLQGPKLSASDATSFAQLGFDVDIHGDTIVAGTVAAAAYVFSRAGTTWSQAAKLTPADQTGNFGWSVAVSGDTIVVGALNDTLNDDVAGAMYVFVFDGSMWTQQAKLRPSDAAPFSFQNMGWSVDIDGDTAVAGAPNGVGGKAVYVFVRSGTTWTEQAKIVPQDADGSGFGRAVAIDGDRVMVGAPFDSTTAPSDGAVYFFTRSGSTWSQESKVTNPSGLGNSDIFGHSVDLHGDTAIVGAPNDDVGVSNSGIAWFLVRNGGAWTVQDFLAESEDLDPNDNFGRSVAVYGDAALVGAPNDDWTNLVGNTTNNLGAATFYELRCEGACCVNGACAILTLGDCAVVGGDFAGLGSSCTGVECDPGCCRGDFNGDLLLNGDDAQGFVEALLNGETCP